MKRPKKISESEACDRAIDRMLEDVPEADRVKLVFAVVRRAGGVQMTPEFTICRSCRTWFVEQKAVA